jgi:hypothetical protein
MKNQLSKIGLENRVLTPTLFASAYSSMRERVRVNFIMKYRYTLSGNRATGNSVEDYLQLGLERLLKYNGFNFETCKDFNNEEITIFGFQKLWFYASQQCLFEDNVKGSTTKKGERTKIVVTNIVTDMDGKECVTNIVENRLLETDSINTKRKPKMNVRSLIRKAIETAENQKDRLFFERLLAHLLIQSSIRKADKVGKAISLKEVMDCFSNQFQSKDAYIMWRSRMETDERIKRLKMVA